MTQRIKMGILAGLALLGLLGAGWTVNAERVIRQRNLHLRQDTMLKDLARAQQEYFQRQSAQPGVKAIHPLLTPETEASTTIEENLTHDPREQPEIIPQR